MSFQSTHSRGVRQIYTCYPWTLDVISIHALTGSATRDSIELNSILTDFNPRTHGECDKFTLAILGPSMSFQSTHSRGVRQIYTCYPWTLDVISIHALTGSATRDSIELNSILTDFNPRTHGECDRQ